MTLQAGTDASSPGIEEVQRFMERAQTADNYDDALKWVAEAVTTQLMHAMKEAKIASGVKELSKPRDYVEVLRRSGLDRLLVEGWVRGRVTYKAAEGHLERLRGGLTGRTLSAQDIKLGILAFDGAAQRLSLAAGSRGFFVYRVQLNNARDSLLTFAGALDG